MMNYNINFKLPEGGERKWKKVGTLKQDKYTPFLSICVEDIEEVLAIAKKHNLIREFKEKHYINLSTFEDDYNKKQDGYKKHNEEKSNGYQPQNDDLDDNVPF